LKTKNFLIKSRRKAEGTNLSDLPNEILLKIFSHLAYRELGRLEQANRRFHSLIRTIWRSISELSFDKLHIFGYERKPNASSLDKSFKSAHVCKIFKNLIAKKLNSSQLKALDISNSPELRFKAAECLDLISKNCKNLTSINMAEFQTEKNRFLSTRFVKFTQMCSNLIELNLSSCPINDYKVECVFSNCRSLESINLSFCQLITGKCFESVAVPNLKTIHLTQCLFLKEKFLLHLFENSSRIRNLYLKDLFRSNSSSESSFILKSIANNLMSTLENFEYTIKKNSLHLEQLCLCGNLTRLDLSNSFSDNKKVATLLNRLKSLRYLDLNSAYNLNDEMFTLLPINAPLEYLDISCLNDLTDATLNALSSNSAHLKRTMKKLEMSCCTKLTREGILRLIESMTSIEYLNMSVIGSVDNAFLESLYTMKNRESKIYICCHFSGLDISEFMTAKRNDESVTMRQSNEQYEIVLKNFTIEVDI
jgi:hypothetical protein